MLKERLENLRQCAPLVHNITNYVTANACANILLACGGSPIMADDVDEVEEITAICGGLNINLGTLNAHTIPSMLMAGKKANELSHPVLLDPVGVGASRLRTGTAEEILKQVSLSVIRGNSSEMKALAVGGGTTKGVDADILDAVDEENLNHVISFAKDFAQKTRAVIAITGAIDIATDGKKTYVIRNGHPMMSRITGTGCMLSAMMTAYVVANPDDILEAVTASLCAMGICGERAHRRLTTLDGNTTYYNYIMDEIFHLDGDILDGGAIYEMR